jgi:phosphoribosylanthranilate isomerase
MLNLGITITGADDKVDPLILDEIGKEYPFVEWGILFSKSREGQPRYPTAEWREQFYWATYHRGDEYTIAAHLCGNSVDVFLSSYSFFENEVTMGFDAIQFNKLTAGNKDSIFKFAKERGDKQDIILQYNDNTNTLLNGMFENEVPSSIKILLDASGGKGISWQDKGWPDVPEPFSSRHHIGYAGGINEHNVEQAVDEVLKMNKDVVEGFAWIDLETGARTDDGFDIDKVIRILEKVKKVKQSEGV